MKTLKILINGTILTISVTLCVYAVVVFTLTALMWRETRHWADDIGSRIELAQQQLAEMKEYCQSVVGDQI